MDPSHGDGGNALQLGAGVDGPRKREVLAVTFLLVAVQVAAFADFYRGTASPGWDFLATYNTVAFASWRDSWLLDLVAGYLSERSRSTAADVGASAEPQQPNSRSESGATPSANEALAAIPYLGRPSRAAATLTAAPRRRPRQPCPGAEGCTCRRAREHPGPQPAEPHPLPNGSQNPLEDAKERWSASRRRTQRHR